MLPMKPRLPSNFRVNVIRTYATRLPERPPYRAPDPLVNNPNAKTSQHPDGLTFIHRPPPTAPTPFSLTTAPASPLLRPAPPPLPIESVSMPPSLRRSEPQREYMSDERIAEMRALRLKDPEYWSRWRLAKQFGCSQWFVGLFARLGGPQRRAQLEKVEQRHEERRAKWSERKILTKEIRRKRREYW